MTKAYSPPPPQQPPRLVALQMTDPPDCDRCHRSANQLPSAQRPRFLEELGEYVCGPCRIELLADQS